MEKLSIYELFSYVLPGFVLIGILDFLLCHVFGINEILNVENLGDSLLVFCIVLFVGIANHVMTFKFFLAQKWYASIVYRSISSIVKKNKDLEKVIPFLKQEFIRLNKFEEKEDNPNVSLLFDFAYFYLETNDKIAPAKSFQSLYFAFRNLFTMCLILLPITWGIVAWTYFEYFGKSSFAFALIIAISNLLIGFLIIPIACWLREKMVERILKSYYSERIHSENK